MYTRDLKIAMLLIANKTRICLTVMLSLCSVTVAEFIRQNLQYDHKKPNSYKMATCYAFITWALYFWNI